MDHFDWQLFWVKNDHDYHRIIIRGTSDQVDQFISDCIRDIFYTFDELEMILYLRNEESGNEEERENGNESDSTVKLF